MKPSRLLLTLLLGVSLFPAHARINDGTDPYCSSSCGPCKPCNEGEGDGDSASESNTPTTVDSSFYFNIPVGVGHTRRPGSLLTSSRLGAVEGMIYQRIRGFDAVFRDSYGQNIINRLPIYMEFEVEQIDQRLYHPSLFRIYSTAAHERIKNTDVANEHFIQQVVSDTTFTHVNILEPNAASGSFNQGTGFRVRSWKLHDFTLGTKVNGLYPIPTEDALGETSLLPYSEVIFKKPASATENNELLTIYRQRFGATGIYEKTEHRIYDATKDSYTITTHEGNSIAGAVIRKVTIQYSNRGTKTWDYTLTRTIEEASTTDGIGTAGPLKVISRNQEVYKDFTPDGSGGEGRRRLMKTVKDVGSENITTTYDYYDDPNNQYVHGRPKSVVNHDKSWKYYEYTDTQSSPIVLHVTYSSWKDVPFSQYQNGRKEELSLTRDSMERVVTIQGQQIAREKNFISLDPDGRTIRTYQRWTGTEWETTRTCYNRDNESAGPRGRIRWIEHADGTATRYSYGYNSGDFLVTEEKGAGDRNSITDGVKTISAYNKSFKLIEEERMDIPQTNLRRGSKIADFNYGIDNLGRPLKWIYNGNPDDYSVMQFGCCGLEFERDRNGSTTTYFRDGLKRVYKVARKRSSSGALVTRRMNLDGLRTETRRVSVDGDLLVSDITRNLAGTQTTTLSPDADGDGNPETTTSHTVYLPAGGMTSTTTYPDLTTTSSTSFIDGGQKQSTDQEGHVSTYDHNTHHLQGGGLVRRMTQPGGTQWTETYTDQINRTFRMEYADGASSTTQYHSFVSGSAGAKGKISQSQDADETASAGTGSKMTYAYSPDGDDVTTTRVLPGQQQTITERIVDTVASIKIHEVTIAPALYTKTTVNGITTSESYRSLDGRTSGSRSFGRESLSQTTLPIDGSWTTTTTQPDGAFAIQTYLDGLMTMSAVYPSGSTGLPAEVVSSNSATHDAFGRVLTQTDSRTGTTTMDGYLENNTLTGLTAPGNRTTTFTYDVMGRRLTVDAPDTLAASGAVLPNITHTSYTDRSQIESTWGDQTYPRRYQYDEQRRMVKLHTYTTLPHGTQPTADGTAITEWVYDSQRGWLTEKNYHGETGHGPGNAAD